MGLALGDRVKVIACECGYTTHVGRFGIVASLGLVKRIRATFADEVLLNETRPFPTPPLNEVCDQPIALELLP